MKSAGAARPTASLFGQLLALLRRGGAADRALLHFALVHLARNLGKGAADVFGMGNDMA